MAKQTKKAVNVTGILVEQQEKEKKMNTEMRNVKIIMQIVAILKKQN